MQISEISMTFGSTVSIGDYSNVRAEVTMRSTVAAFERPGDVLASLIELAEEHLHDLIDTELETVGRSPKYDDRPLVTNPENGPADVADAEQQAEEIPL